MKFKQANMSFIFKKILSMYNILMWSDVLVFFSSFFPKKKWSTLEKWENVHMSFISWRLDSKKSVIDIFKFVPILQPHTKALISPIRPRNICWEHSIQISSIAYVLRCTPSPPSCFQLQAMSNTFNWSMIGWKVFEAF